MSERFGREEGPAPEREDALYEVLVEANREENRLWEEIDAILASEPDRDEAERRVLEEHADKLALAKQRSREALNRWLTEIRRRT